ncbi:MAG: alpha-amylase family glycosyl hydrolase [Terracidiphilus sp.]
MAGTIAQPQQGTALQPVTAQAAPASPEWMKDLIIYEIATKGFTSPKGPESGTFNSLRGRLSYLQELGITGIWLTGYSVCDPHHFYNIWTQYAVIEPDKFDPTLGTAEEFKELIHEAHQRGIKVFLDVITHGLMKNSPVIKAHPAWFRGSSWGMTDFDWSGGHADLDDWWVKIYTEFVTLYGVDGYRLDVSIYRPDLWERVRINAAAAGHPIVIWEEGNSAIPGVTDFTQAENVFCTHPEGVVDQVLLNDLPGFYDRKFGRIGVYDVQVDYQDGSSRKGNTQGEGALGVHLAGLSADRVGRRRGEPQPDGLPDVKIRLQNVQQKPIANVTVRNDEGDIWQLRATNWMSRPLLVDAHKTDGKLVAGPGVDIYIATLSWGSSLQLSCHDNGWAGFPLDKNPFVVQGSRSVFGYSVLFSPMIPIFFSGEEFDAAFHALPDLSPNLYGDKDAGKGRWLYGAMLDWNELKAPEHREMFIDVKKMMAIRKKYSEILAMCPGGKEPNLKAITFEANIKVPVPYVRWNERSAIVVAANGNRDENASLKLKIDLAQIELGGHGSYTLTDLWSTAEPRKLTAAELGDLSCTVKRDGVAGGGLAVFRIQPA